MNKLTLLLVIVGACLVLAPTASAQLNGGDSDCDNTNTVSDLTYLVAFLFQGGPAPCDISVVGEPIAYGVIMPDGTIANGSGNFTCVWNAAASRYDITIEGEAYFYTNYITQVTPHNYPTFANASSAGGKLLVYLRDQANNAKQDYFQFSTFKIPTVRQLESKGTNGDTDTEQASQD